MANCRMSTIEVIAKQAHLLSPESEPTDSTGAAAVEHRLNALNACIAHDLAEAVLGEAMVMAKQTKRVIDTDLVNVD